MGRKRRGSSEDEAEWTEEGEARRAGGKKKEEGRTKKAKAGEEPAAKVAKLTSFPASFLCSSGEALWGHIQTVLEGADTTHHDGMAGPTMRPIGGGTIMQNDFVYRAAVRVGTWKATRAYIDGDHVGFVLHHEDVSALDLLKRAAKVGIRGKCDEQVVYINRYDWSWHHGDSSAVVERLGTEDEEVVEQLRGGRLFFLDPRNLSSFLSAIKKKPDLDRSVAFTAGAGEPFGVQLMGEDTEYELGWLVYSGKKHSTFTDADELVGMVYDCAYCGLHNAEDEEGEPSVDE